MCAGAPGSEPGAAGGRRPYLEVRASPDGRDPATLPRRHPRAWGTHIRPLEATRHVALRARSVLLEGGHRKPRLHELLAVDLGGHLVADRPQAEHVRLPEPLDRRARALGGKAAASPRRGPHELEPVLDGKYAELVTGGLVGAHGERHVRAPPDALRRSPEQL